MQGPSAARMSLRRGAERAHRRDGRLHDARQRAFPARMRRADDAGLGVGEQDHAAVGAGDAEREAGRRGHQPVAARPRLGRPGLRYGDHVGGVDLVGNGEKFGRDAERRRHARAISRDRLGRVARTDAAVQRGVHAFGRSAAAGEEGVAQSRRLERVRTRDSRPWSRRLGRTREASAALRWEIAIALNSAPISPSPLPTSRWRASSNSPARSGERSHQRARAASMPIGAQEIALVDRPVDRGARRARAARHRGEIDMRGDVGLAGVDQRIDHLVRAQRLQRVAEAGDAMSVVDEQRDAALAARGARRARNTRRWAVGLTSSTSPSSASP